VLTLLELLKIRSQENSKISIFVGVRLGNSRTSLPPPKRKLEKSEQRRAAETRAQRTEMPEIAGQRPPPAQLTRGNVGSSRQRGKISQETALRGCLPGRLSNHVPRTAAWI